MTLDDKIVEVLKNENVYSPYEEYIFYHQKYIHCLMAASELPIFTDTYNDIDVTEKDAQIVFGVLSKMSMKYNSISNKHLGDLITELNKQIDLTSIVDINGYTEFDALEWYVDYQNKYEIKIRYRPTGTNVSFCMKSPSDIKWVNEV